MTPLPVRGAVQRSKHDGYTEATGVPGYGRYELDDADDLSWRLGGKWAPFYDFSVTLNTIHYRSDTHGPAQKNISRPATRSAPRDAGLHRPLLRQHGALYRASSAGTPAR